MNLDSPPLLKGNEPDSCRMQPTLTEARDPMGIKIDALKCINCMACEMACSYHRDDGFAFLSSCIVAYRAREKQDYFGVLLKEEEQLVVFRPEGVPTGRGKRPNGNVSKRNLNPRLGPGGFGIFRPDNAVSG